MVFDPDLLIPENERRLKELHEPYDPISGSGSPIPRFPITFTCLGKEYCWYLPLTMRSEGLERLNELGSVERILLDKKVEPTPMCCVDFLVALINSRFPHDFEFWAYSCASIQPKDGNPIRFKCNRAQRKVLAVMEEDRVAGKQGLYNMLKCRQFGGSTFTRIYFTWIQLYIIAYAQCAIIAEVEGQADVAVQMVETIIDYYPPEVGELKLSNIQGKRKSREILYTSAGKTEKRGTITIGSVEKPNALRGRPWRLVHATEVGLWGETTKKSASDLNKAITSGMPIGSGLYLIHMRESTAKGMNYWYKEWQKSEQGKSGYRNIFVATFEMEQYQKYIPHYPTYIQTISHMSEQDRDYAMAMWDEGATLEAIYYWFDHRDTMGHDHEAMLEEYPNFPIDAFQASGRRVFPIRYVQNIRHTCCLPTWTGDITADDFTGEEAFKNISFSRYAKGELLVWSKPDTTIKIANRYAVSVDIGGRWEGADYSVIRVFDRIGLMDGGQIEVVATWRGHLDSDLVAWKAAQIAAWYNNALLVVEKNSLDRTDEENPGDGYLTILNEIVDYYSNIYTGTTPDKVREGVPIRYGFHTNASSRQMVIATLVKLARTTGYIERYDQMPYEMDRFIVTATGKPEHAKGEKDDCVICTAIGLYVAIEKMPPPTVVKEKEVKVHHTTPRTESSFI